MVDFLIERAGAVPDLIIRRGTERGYPDLEFTGPLIAGDHYAVDVKVARRKPARGPSTKTQSRITLFTGNTFFRYPDLHWPGTFRPFAGYAQHLDLIALDDLAPDSLNRVANLEVLAHESWTIASRKRSSTTREYLGAVDDLEMLREGRGSSAAKLSSSLSGDASPSRSGAWWPSNSTGCSLSGTGRSGIGRRDDVCQGP